MKKTVLSFILALGLVLNADALMAGNVLKGRVEADGKGLPSVVVSDGFTCVLTDADGRYEFEAHPQSRFVFVSTPAGYLPPVEEGSIPVFYKKIAGEGTYDFRLGKNPEDDTKHVCFVQSDVQLVEAGNLDTYAGILDDLMEYRSQFAGADIFGLDCGDIVGDTPSLYAPYKETVSRLEMPVYRAIGNHDMDYYGRSFETSYRRFEGLFGPSYYSFNRGKVHYVVINNNFYVGREYFYIGYVDEAVFRWLEQDLSYVPEGSTVIMAMHMPTRLVPDVRPFEYSYQGLADQTVNASALHGLLAPYNAHIISGHMHYNLNVCFSDSLMEHNTAAVCGTWWCTDVCLDGTPAGYAVYTVDGDDVEWIYKSSGYSAEYQFRAYLPGASAEFPDAVVANVWNYDPQWKVEWCENGKVMGEMEKFTGHDPYAAVMCRDTTRIHYAWIGPTPTEHVFKAVPSDPSADITVRVTDRFGNVYTAPASELVYP
ncbi:MAG TPA: calcineurin-like phosphoesterase C-terminal domain-containing protein [Candidatus Cryptobacteroides intestinipullorum]|nr:calcineurin-like phosphoesterase C-terminal domain-containing protein [Candidatus Cryptobacteroides intestinipullorum]